MRIFERNDNIMLSKQEIQIETTNDHVTLSSQGNQTTRETRKRNEVGKN